RAAPLVLQRMDHRSQRAVVAADRPGAIDRSRASPAARTAGERGADRSPGGERVAAAIADRRSERPDRLPASLADRTASRVLEQFVARGARRCENDRRQRVDETCETGSTPPAQRTDQ